jgi:hypothetical protein
VLSTSRVLLESMEAYDTPLAMRDSQFFVLPMLRYRGIEGVSREDLYTLPQVFLELLDPAVTAHTIHLQVYGYNDFFVDAIKGLLGPLALAAGPLLGGILGRLMVIQGYLHSDVSSAITTTLRVGAGGPTLVLEAAPNGATRRVIGSVVKSLFRHRTAFKAIPLSPLLRICEAGRGAHSGGTFPMRVNPRRFESDCWGRPYGFERVHAVDATVFPSIPAGPITFTVVANAHRIATEYPDP